MKHLYCVLLFYQTPCLSLDLNKFLHNYYIQVIFKTVITIPNIIFEMPENHKNLLKFRKKKTKLVNYLNVEILNSSLQK